MAIAKVRLHCILKRSYIIYQGFFNLPDCIFKLVALCRISLVLINNRKNIDTIIMCQIFDQVPKDLKKLVERFSVLIDGEYMFLYLLTYVYIFGFCNVKLGISSLKKYTLWYQIITTPSTHLREFCFTFCWSVSRKTIF